MGVVNAGGDGGGSGDVNAISQTDRLHSDDKVRGSNLTHPYLPLKLANLFGVESRALACLALQVRDLFFEGCHFSLQPPDHDRWIEVFIHNGTILDHRHMLYMMMGERFGWLGGWLVGLLVGSLVGCIGLAWV